MFNFLLNLFGEDKLYKFVYDTVDGYSWSRKENTLLITAKSATDAVKKFHEMTKNKVGHISEFIELRYPPMNNSEGGSSNAE